MSRDLYAAVAGASATWAQLESVSNDMANVSTTGYRDRKIAFRITGQGGPGLGPSYVQAAGTYASQRDGSVVEDGDPHHLALQGPGWFTVDTGQGEALTRDGRFHVDAEGRLATAEGQPVQGIGGEIVLPPDESLRVAEDGTLYGSESGVLGKLKIVEGAAEPLGGNLWRAVGATTEVESPRVAQGAVESSNVDPMETMVELIEASRFFEAFEKAMQASDDLDHRLNRLGGS